MLALFCAPPSQPGLPGVRPRLDFQLLNPGVPGVASEKLLKTDYSTPDLNDSA